MAVYRLEVKTMRRAAGQSAVAAAAYRAAEYLKDERTGELHDYRPKARGVVFRHTLAPKDAPAWVHDRGRLWNEAERAEPRKNSVVARELLGSLPHELNDVQRIALVSGFAADVVARYQTVVDFAIHRPSRQGDDRNHHFHMMMTTRRIGRDGFTEKTRELDDMKKLGPQEIHALRELWEQHQNQALERAQRPERVSRLSNEARGIEREPQPKLGPTATALLRRGEPSHIGARWKQVAERNASKAKQAQANHSPMRQAMARQRSAKQEAEKKEAIRRALDAARQQATQRAADAMTRDTSEYQRGQQEAQQVRKDEARKLDEERTRRAEVSAAKAWAQQRQAELRRQRQAREQANENQHDPGRTMKPPGGRRLD